MIDLSVVGGREAAAVNTSVGVSAVSVLMSSCVVVLGVLTVSLGASVE